MSLNVAVMGAGGRMGRVLVKAISENPGLRLVGASEHSASAHLGADAGELAGVGKTGVLISDKPDVFLKDAEAVIDFTLPHATVALLKETSARKLIHIIGTTGLSDTDKAAITEAAKSTTIVQSGNMSLGVNLLGAVVKKVAAALDADFDIEIVEMHHNRKIDAPSGTALLLGEAAAAGRQVRLDDVRDSGRDGETGARKRGDIGFAALRGGTVIGDHNVIFAGPYERLELRHVAEDRGLFARGALKAAMWAQKKPAGYYTMADVLGLNDL